MDNVILFDTETTGFGPCRMTELAWKKDHKDPVIDELRVRPPIPIEDSAAAVHGITNEIVAGLPLFIEDPAYPAIKDLFERSIMVAHYAEFDIGVMEREGIKIDAFICTKKVAKMLYPGAPNLKLQTLREYLNIEVEGLAHSAAGDVAVLFGVFTVMLADLMGPGDTEEDAIRTMIAWSL